MAPERLLQRRQQPVARERLDRVARRTRPPGRRACSSRAPRRRRARTVHAPQTPCSQPTCVPVSPRRWRRKSVSSRRGSTASRTARPLTVSSISVTRRSRRARALDERPGQLRGGSARRGVDRAGRVDEPRRERRPRPAPLRRLPASRSAAPRPRRARVGRSVTAPTATRRRATTPSPSRAARRRPSTGAKSPARSASSSNAVALVRRRAAARRVSTTSSPGSSVVGSA